MQTDKFLTIPPSITSHSFVVLLTTTLLLAGCCDERAMITSRRADFIQASDRYIRLLEGHGSPDSLMAAHRDVVYAYARWEQVR